MRDARTHDGGIDPESAFFESRAPLIERPGAPMRGKGVSAVVRRVPAGIGTLTISRSAHCGTLGVATAGVWAAQRQECRQAHRPAPSGSDPKLAERLGTPSHMRGGAVGAERAWPAPRQLAGGCAPADMPGHRGGRPGVELARRRKSPDVIGALPRMIVFECVWLSEQAARQANWIDSTDVGVTVKEIGKPWLVVPAKSRGKEVTFAEGAAGDESTVRVTVSVDPPQPATVRIESSTAAAIPAPSLRGVLYLGARPRSSILSSIDLGYRPL